ncbi:SAM-dependent methyltransferase [Streptomyces sp. P6-2-1]|uniref:SAM-dependent methyltransferase n=1 Tax=Streptomyces sp. P6-2-1 TaxID=3422591 RepID=UPI003D36A042
MPDTGESAVPPYVDTTRPHPARVYDYWLGGKDNYPVDEELGARILALEPGVRDLARANRAFMRRVTGWAAGEGIRQFLDIGTGIPTEPNLHQVSQAIAPESRVVYCDNDPIVLAHAEALMTGTPQGATAYIQADFRDPAKILEQAAETLDLSEPVQLSLIALLHFVSDEQGAREVTARLADELAPGSTLVITHASYPPGAEWKEDTGKLYEGSRVMPALRSEEEIRTLFRDFTLVEPGLVHASAWRPELDGSASEGAGLAASLPFYAGVGRKG